MMPGYWPGPSGQTAKVGMAPYLVVTMTSCSSIAAVLRSGEMRGAEPRAIAGGCHAVCSPFDQVDPSMPACLPASGALHRKPGHSGARPKAASPEPIFQRPEFMGSGLAAPRRPGMTGILCKALQGG